MVLARGAPPDALLKQKPEDSDKSLASRVPQACALQWLAPAFGCAGVMSHSPERRIRLSSGTGEFSPERYHSPQRYQSAITGESHRACWLPCAPGCATPVCGCTENVAHSPERRANHMHSTSEGRGNLYHAQSAYRFQCLPPGFGGCTGSGAYSPDRSPERRTLQSAVDQTQQVKTSNQDPSEQKQAEHADGAPKEHDDQACDCPACRFFRDDPGMASPPNKDPMVEDAGQASRTTARPFPPPVSWHHMTKNLERVKGWAGLVAPEEASVECEREQIQESAIPPKAASGTPKRERPVTRHSVPAEGGAIGPVALQATYLKGAADSQIQRGIASGVLADRAVDGPTCGEVQEVAGAIQQNLAEEMIFLDGRETPRAPRLTQAELDQIVLGTTWNKEGDTVSAGGQQKREQSAPKLEASQSPTRSPRSPARRQQQRCSTRCGPSASAACSTLQTSPARSRPKSAFLTRL